MAERDKIWGWGGARVIWVRTGVASTGWWATCHTKPEALNVFFDKVTKVWMIYLKSERDRISNTRPFFVFCKWWFVDVSSLCRPFFFFFFFFLLLLVFFLYFLCLEFLYFHFLKTFFYFSGVAKVSRIDTQSQKAPELAFPIPRKFLYFILLSHIFDGWICESEKYRKMVYLQSSFIHVV